MPGAAITGTSGPIPKPNQSKVFYHDGFWWACLYDGVDHFLWKKNTDGTWTKQTGTGALDLRASARPDCVVDGAANKLYVLFNHPTAVQFFRCTYSAGAWSKDTGATDIAVPGVAGASDNETSFGRAKNGTLFAGAGTGNALKVNWSADSGVTWQAAATSIKTGLVSANSLTDWIPFAWNGFDWIGLFAGENTAAGSKYHFLRLKDGDAPGTVANWIDESANLPSFGGTGQDSDDHVCIHKGSDNKLYAVFKTDGGGLSTDAIIGLFVRDTATPTAGWAFHAVMLISETNKWTRPAVLVDDVNSELYAMGAIEAASSTKIQYRKSALSSLSTIKDQARVDLIGPNATDDYDDVSVAIENPTATSDALVIAQNITGNVIWENTIDILAGAPSISVAAIQGSTIIVGAGVAN